MKSKNKNKNLMILGANGALGHSTLVYLKNHRALFDKIILIDKDQFEENAFITLKEIDAKFYKMLLSEDTLPKLEKLLYNHQIDIVLDVTDAPTEMVAQHIFNYQKASYICCAFCTKNPAPFGEALEQWLTYIQKKKYKKPHILFTGMNPGSVNVWAAIGIQKFGRPKEIIEFEYDTSRFLHPHKEKIVTWCIEEFIEELITDPAEIVLGKHKIKNLYPNGIFHRQELEELFKPILELPHYPDGCVTMHEECLTLGNKYNFPCRFVYSVNHQTMRYIKDLYESKGTVTEADLELGDNIKDPLIGSDNIAIRLDYGDRYVYYFNTIANKTLKESSATDYQVTVGVFATLFTLLENQLKPGVHFTEDLLSAFFPKFLSDNMMIREYVFQKKTNGKLELLSYDPHISFGKGQFIKL